MKQHRSLCRIMHRRVGPPLTLGCQLRKTLHAPRQHLLQKPACATAEEAQLELSDAVTCSDDYHNPRL